MCVCVAACVCERVYVCVSMCVYVCVRRDNPLSPRSHIVVFKSGRMVLRSLPSVRLSERPRKAGEVLEFAREGGIHQRPLYPRCRCRFGFDSSSGQRRLLLANLFVKCVTLGSKE